MSAYFRVNTEHLVCVAHAAIAVLAALLFGLSCGIPFASAARVGEDGTRSLNCSSGFQNPVEVELERRFGVAAFANYAEFEALSPAQSTDGANRFTSLEKLIFMQLRLGLYYRELVAPLFDQVASTKSDDEIDANVSDRNQFNHSVYREFKTWLVQAKINHLVFTRRRVENWVRNELSVWVPGDLGPEEELVLILPPRVRSGQDIHLFLQDSKEIHVFNPRLFASTQSVLEMLFWYRDLEAADLN